ncbi:MAG: replicative DNA helicase [Spirochaetes bacterium GWD1_27_9]|nr:MAG: replicative DNA helicase [Spirochaetes bacterium GWB1_27_13]OHD21652.1 MAG: replicative DNA helicase [Spirochaetes bacterium GWC1_27_15]OHD34954.1 MAG: replicative DNA helicase [Spirochaetes bacterium GWD1_27_9]
MSDDLERRVPPQNIEAEMYLLASILIDNQSLDKITQFKVGPDDFYDEKHKNIFKAMFELKKINKPIDIITLREILKTLNLLDKVGGTEYVSSLIDKIPTTANVEYYAEIVKSKAMLRQLIYVSSDIIGKSMGNPQDVKSLIDEAEKRIFDINQDIYSSSLSLISKILNEAINEMANTKAKEGELTGVPSGYPELDEKTDGFQKSELIILAARPSMGKTSLGLNIITNASIKYKKKIGIFSCEMSKSSLVRRMLCSEASVNEMLLRRGVFGKDIEDKIVRAAGRLYETTIVFDDSPNIPILELRSKARKMKKDYDIDLLLIDYLQLVTVGDEMGKNTPRHEQIAYVSRSLKGLARDLNIPVIALAQLNRNLEARGEESRPRLSDLKDSGSIEQDADLILFIHKVETKGQESPEANKDIQSEVREIIIGKNRNGPTDIIKLLFMRNYTRFQNMTKESPEGYSTE